VSRILTDAWVKAREAHGWLIGRFVIMPDHVHFFAASVPEKARTLSQFVRYWKRQTGIEIRRSRFPSFAWQTEFFDHVMRSEESYADKWEYVRLNPVRARLVADATQWPYQGEINPLAW
jgi:REP element-mobilizing transposase RayT